jgi:spore maturation protein CgeB
MKILCVFGEYNYGDPTRGQGYEYTNFIPALRRLGHEVVFFESLNKGRYEGFIDLNLSFLKTVERERPDIILCVLVTYELWIETLEIVRDYSDAALINWSTDDSWKYEQFSRFLSPSFDLYATTYRSALLKSRKEGLSNFVLTQWAANAQTLAEPLKAKECRYQVSFVGSAYGNRIRWVDDLQRKGINVECFGHGWRNGPVEAVHIPRIMRESVISLNFGDSGVVMHGLLPQRSRQIKARVFEVTGAGGFLVTENTDDIDHYFIPGEEIVLFDGIEEAAEKITFFLSHPDERDRMARAGFERTRREHIYDIRFQELLDVISKERGPRQVPQMKKSWSIDRKKFADLERIHRTGSGLRFLRSLVTCPGVLLWGPTRGPRAARRFVFELSWRLFGRKTYSAAGWPGRMFYFES